MIARGDRGHRKRSAIEDFATRLDLILANA